MKEMEDILTEGTAKTPQIDFNKLSGELILSGRSIPENAAKIYEPVIAWLDGYIQLPNKTTNLRLNLEYFNTATSLWVAKIIKKLGTIKDADCKLFIHFYFNLEETDNMDGELIKDIIGSLVDNIGETMISIGVKVYGTDDTGKIVTESTVYI